MSDILDEILANKRVEVERDRQYRTVEQLRARPAFAAPTRNFYGAIAAPVHRRPNLIAEIKLRSPSAGLIVADFDPPRIARMYAGAGAAALSVLTDETYFGGRPEYIEQVKAAVDLPVLRKDFIVDEYQIHESRAFGADAILLICEALTGEQLTVYTTTARRLGLCVLVEVHTRAALMKFIAAVPEPLRDHVLLGINNRNLKIQQVDLATTEQVAEVVPPGLPIVSESGIKTRKDVERMHKAGARGLLIGETLLRADDPGAKIKELFG